jgi:hypothetical protein
LIALRLRCDCDIFTKRLRCGCAAIALQYRRVIVAILHSLHCNCAAFAQRLRSGCATIAQALQLHCDCTVIVLRLRDDKGPCKATQAFAPRFHIDCAATVRN